MASKSSQYPIVEGGVSAPRGFLCSAVQCGIKNAAKLRLDLGLIYSEQPAVTAACFTSNKVKAAPVRVCQSHLRSNDVRAVIVNSGNANACTGPRGIADAKKMCAQTAAELNLQPQQVLVGSTGIIGLPMPMERITPKIPALVSGLARGNGDDMARAIMTSDTRPKSIAIEVPIGSKTVRIGAIAKGAGMISPSMGTMLCYITTDAAVGLAELKKCVSGCVQNTFNRITIDGDTSTNDTVVVMANGAAGNRSIKSGGPQCQAFRQALEWVMLQMAKAIVGDGERVTKFVEVIVRGAPTHMDARKVAETVANSLLVKCSWNGGDANWGRIMHAIGYSRARIREDLIDIYFDGHIATRNGIAAGTPVELLRKAVAKREFSVTIDLNCGEAAYNVYTSDLSQEYVDFNRTEYAAPVK
jgi:glutamate N-acetyltransferase / amino-acid N-acetyltransferase